MATFQTAGVERATSDGSFQNYKLVPSKTLYKGALAIIVAASGLAVSSNGVNTLGAGDIFAGIVRETKTSAATGTTQVEVFEHGVFTFPYTGGGLTDANVGDIVYGNDLAGDGAVGAIDAAAGHINVNVGQIVEVLSATSCRVRIDLQIGAIAVAHA